MDRGYLHPFQDGRQYLYGVGERPRTLLELAMCQLSAHIRSTKNWWKEYGDHQFRTRWAEEAAERSWTVRSPSGSTLVTLSRRQINYVLDELDGYAALRDEMHGCEVSSIDRIWHSDSLLDSETLSSLDTGLQCLPGRPNDDSVSVDLVDPFFHCLVYNRTQVYDSFAPESFSLQTRPINTPPSFDYACSSRFACIPTAFSVSRSDGSLEAKVLSYINNIDPSNTSLYHHIEHVVSRCVTLFEYVLTDLHRNNPLCQRITGSYRYTEWNEPEEPEFSDDDDGWLAYEREVRQWTLHRPIQPPDVPEQGYPRDLHTRHFKVTLDGRVLRLIVRVTDIRVAPGGPVYTGTPWHVEGMRNENIVACTMLCTSMTNLVPPSLEFRMAITAPRMEAGDVGAAIRTWGLDHFSARNQYLGHIPLSPGSAVAFPNLYQHRLTATHLRDPNHEGSMTFLGLYLMDPELDAYDGKRDSGWETLSPSSDTVPPQQKEWMRRAVEDSIDVRLPFEIVERIVEEVEGVMTAEEAAAYAKEMREERERFWTLHDEYRFCLPFDIWEVES
ncbi:hypothetical protein SCP_0102150 [Sparassis crispa]|uniref:Uncharacterized protein n=1 Tax=Sparassis crispa TaxID=139825 RepID=A0A401G5A3_9APHY|nr:hypothetical protein SCP_0102150 [Sparassis crispa]GBE77342.1 hypothetical protein SCP_0102150 [Sparassis crispa]